MNNLKSKRAFTLVELLVVLAIMAVLAAVLLPWLVANGRMSQRIDCVNNLKEVGLAFRVWEGDNSDKFPMAISTASGGTEENTWSAQNSGIITTPANFGTPSAIQYYWLTTFEVMSNELSTPKILACPSDAGKNALNTWTNGASLIAATSYFVCGNAADNYPQMILSGDRNIGTLAAVGTTAALTTNVSSTYALATQLKPLQTGWTAADLHQRVGNIGLADGSVAQVTISGLQTALQNATNGGPTGSPAYNFPN